MSTLEEAAARIGGHRWVEMRLFELLGASVASAPDAAAKAVLDRHSQHHAWRAGQWWDRLPVLASVDREALVQPPSAETVESFSVLAGADGVSRLAGAYRVLVPRLLVAYRNHRGGLTPVADAPVIRTLDHVTVDLAADWLEGEALVQRLIGSRADADSAAAMVGRLEALILSSG